MTARINRIHDVIEAHRSAGTLTYESVLNELNNDIPRDAVREVQMYVTLHAVWGSLFAQPTAVNAEIIRAGLLGGRPETTVLEQAGSGGGVSRAHQIDPEEVSDPTTFGAVR